MKRAAPVALLSMVLAFVGAVTFPGAPTLAGDVPAFITGLVRWDAGWYGNIADNGYWFTPGEQSPVAFFPLYPLAMHGLTVLGVNRWVAGSGLSLVCALVALWGFARWAAKVSPSHALTAFWLLTLYPFAEYLYGVVYSDAMFLCLVVGAFYSLERGKPVLAAVLGMFATACRPVAPAVVMGLVLRSLELRRSRGDRIRVVDLVPALSGLGLAGFMTYLQWRFGDALAFAHVQGAPGWDQAPGWHSWLKVPWFQTMFPRVAPLVAIRLGGHALFTVLALALVVPTYRRLGWGYGTYCLLVVGIPALSSKDFQGLGRYVMAAFPLFLTLASMVDERPRVRPWLLVGSGSLLAVLAYALGGGGYVA